MNSDALVDLISRLVVSRLADRGETAPQLSRETNFLDGDLPLDSLDLAATVVELQEQTGKDPFEEGFVEFRTIGDLADLFSGVS